MSNLRLATAAEREKHFAQLGHTPLCWSSFHKAGATNTACEEIIEARRSLIYETLQFLDTELWMLLREEPKPSIPSRILAQLNKC